MQNPQDPAPNPNVAASAPAPRSPYSGERDPRTGEVRKDSRTKINDLLEQLQGDMPRSEVERIKAALKTEFASLQAGR